MTEWQLQTSWHVLHVLLHTSDALRRLCPTGRRWREVRWVPSWQTHPLMKSAFLPLTCFLLSHGNFLFLLAFTQSFSLPADSDNAISKYILTYCYKKGKVFLHGYPILDLSPVAWRVFIFYHFPALPPCLILQWDCNFPKDRAPLLHFFCRSHHILRRPWTVYKCLLVDTPKRLLGSLSLSYTC